MGGNYAGATVVAINSAVNFAVVDVKDPARFGRESGRDTNVRYVEENSAFPMLQRASVDLFFPFQHGPQQVRAPEGWDRTRGDLSGNVCILDTGVRYTHEDLAGTRWLGGYDYVNGDADPWDDHGHGTHVAGIAAATLDNVLGIAGMGNIGFYAVKVLDNFGLGTWANVANGLTWCADHAGPRTVISMSLGGTKFSHAARDAAHYAYSTKGHLLVAAAGNGGPCKNCILYPARIANVIAVTCTAKGELPCAFSSTGPQSEMAAPGEHILSTCAATDSAYCFQSGTSILSLARVSH